MRKPVRPLLCVTVCLPLMVSVAFAGPVNPDISVIGDTRVLWSGASGKTTLELQEVEFAFLGPVNPYASAEVFIGVHGAETFEIEEAKLILDRYLPGGLGLTVGRMLVDFGQINTVHSHAFPFGERPLMHGEYFGSDGILDTGLRLDWIAPVEAFTLRATAGVVRGDVFLGGHDHDIDHGQETVLVQTENGHLEESPEPELGGTARVEVFLEPSRDTALLVGSSLLYGEHDPVKNASATWIDVDAKGRLDLGPHRSLLINAEAVFGSLEKTAEQRGVNPAGWFLSTDFRVNKRWNLGGFLESADERGDDHARTHRGGVFVGMALMEESTVFRLVGKRTDPPEGDSETGVFLQVLFGLGPHRPHRY